jgi:endo-1,4-beta-xylanase
LLAALTGGAAGSAACVWSDADREQRRAHSAFAAGTSLGAGASERGLLFGTSAATWQLADRAYERLVREQAAAVLTEDDLLWYRIRPTPGAELDFRRADRFVASAQEAGQPVIGAHLVWDEGFGPGWDVTDLGALTPVDAEELLLGTVQATVARYRGQVALWSVGNEVVASTGEGHDRGLRTDVPWYGALGPSYVGDAFAVAHEADPHALLMLNEFGHETDGAGSLAADKRAATLQVLDELLAADSSLGVVGLQAHLAADGFAERFDAAAYTTFLDELADRGVRVLVSELDVLDDGLPSDRGSRERGVAEVYRRYLDTVLDHEVLAGVLTFGLSDRYTWLQEEQPRTDGRPRTALPFDRELRPTAVLDAVRTTLAGVRVREPLLP